MNDAQKTYLYMTPFFPSPESWRGGFCYDAVKALMRNGDYTVRVMVVGEGADYEIDGIPVARFPRRTVGDSDYFPYLQRWQNERLFLRKLAGMGIDPTDVAVCHINEVSEYAVYAGALKKRNPKCLTLATHHWACDWASTKFGRFGYVPVLSEIKYLWLHHLNLLLDVHLFVSEAGKRGFGKYLTGVEVWIMADIRQQLLFPRLLPPMRYKEAKVVYNGVDRRLFHPAPIPHEGYVIGCVGNFTPGKRQIDLLEAFPDILKAMPDARLRFLGSGTELESCKRFVRENGLADKVEFLSEVPHTEMPKFYNLLDVFVLPSVNEAFCCALIEAQACGLPIICCKGISTEEVMNEEAKKIFLVEPYSPRAIATRISDVRERHLTTDFAIDLDIDATVQSFLKWVDTKYAGHESYCC